MESKFFKVKCTKCKNEQTTYSHASMQVKCLVCGAPIIEPAGGKAKVLMQTTELG